MSGCNDCIEYKLCHNLLEPVVCDCCGKKALVWKQDDYGTFYLECSNCSALAAVDLNTPCESEELFRQPTKVVIQPFMAKPMNQVILEASKYFHVNAMNMRERLLLGFSVELRGDELEELTAFLQKHNIGYKVIQPDDPREKYTYYKHCRYPYSPMRKYSR